MSCPTLKNHIKWLKKSASVIGLWRREECAYSDASRRWRRGSLPLPLSLTSVRLHRLIAHLFNRLWAGAKTENKLRRSERRVVWTFAWMYQVVGIETRWIHRVGMVATRSRFIYKSSGWLVQASILIPFILTSFILEGAFLPLLLLPCFAFFTSFFIILFSPQFHFFEFLCANICSIYGLAWFIW